MSPNYGFIQRTVMTVTLLFDLDDTLLHTNMDRFLPGYFEILGQALECFGTQERITEQIQFAVQKMVANTDPSKTLKEIFDQHFYEPLGTTEETCQGILATFYRDEYPQLKPITQTKPESISLMAWCRSQGMIIAIATNPLFPQTATRQRIQWAGLDPDEFAFYTTYNDFHFTKPNLSYYAEVIGRLGWPEGPIVMIGDNLTLDLLPMQTIGFETFWIDPESQNTHQSSGALSDVKSWLTKVRHHDNKLNNHRDVNLAILQSTPAVFDSWLRHPPTHHLWEKPSKKLQQYTNILLKLTEAEKNIFLPYCENIYANLSELNPAINNIHIKTLSDNPDQKPQEAFSEFLTARQKTLSIINEVLKISLNNKSNAINKKHPDALEALMGVMSQHDRHHLHQCVKKLNIYKIY